MNHEVKTQSTRQKTLKVVFLPGVCKEMNLLNVPELLDKVEKQAIGISPWEAYTANVQADFTVAYGKDCIALKYCVKEPYSKPVYFKTNDPVYRDSCVEFFIAFNDDTEYYNFEFNNAGTCLAGFGRGKERNLLPEQHIHQIKYLRSFKNSGPAALMNWELTLIIPFEVFCFHNISRLEGLHGKGNFFKCGDDLPEPHYLVWNPIETGTPNFHLPEYFGLIDFV